MDGGEGVKSADSPFTFFFPFGLIFIAIMLGRSFYGNQYLYATLFNATPDKTVFFIAPPFHTFVKIPMTTPVMPPVGDIKKEAVTLKKGRDD